MVQTLQQIQETTDIRSAFYRLFPESVVVLLLLIEKIL